MNLGGAQVVDISGESLLGAPGDVGGIADLQVRIHPDEHLGGGYLIDGGGGGGAKTWGCAAA